MRVEGRIVEHALDTRLAIIEIAAHAIDADVVTLLRGHLLELDIAHATVWIEDDNGDMVTVCKALQGRLAGIAARRHGDEVIVIRTACRTMLVDACREEHRQALQRHVLEGAGGAMP